MVEARAHTEGNPQDVPDVSEWPNRLAKGGRVA
jgi:hypothetical protein